MVCIIGPTSGGKSSLAVRIAGTLDGEIVNCDSMQMVRELEIGTAKPSARERSIVPHHLFDFISLPETYSAGRYMADARKVCNEVRGRGKVPIVTGGTGLYLRALLRGMFEGPSRSDEIRRRLDRIAEKKGLAFLHVLLSRKDPEAASRIEPGDRIRLFRALEVQISTGRPFSSLLGGEEPLSGFRVVKIGLDPPRPLLYERINRRAERMFQEGLLEETRKLLEHGYDASCKGFEALGYRHAIRVIQGVMDQSKALELTQRDSRRYAKRQMTWFRREPGVEWIHDTGDTEEAFRAAMEIIFSARERTRVKKENG